MTMPTQSFDMNTPGFACNRGRYVFMRLPGTAKILSICELQVFQKLPYVWRQLSGVAEVAT
jgi:hypothetical protein